MRVHTIAAARLRDSHPEVWTKLGRSAMETAALGRCKYFLTHLQNELTKSKGAEHVKQNLFLRTRDVSIVYEGTKVARFEHGKDRYDLERLAQMGFTEAGIRETMSRQDERP
eukprot:4251536-Amphidinium_carterae.1